MKLLTSEQTDALVNAVLQCFTDGRTGTLERFLEHHPTTDIFTALFDERVTTKLFPRWHDLSFDSWLLEIDTWLDTIQDPSRQIMTESAILFTLWDHFYSNLTNCLRTARISAGIPTNGSVIAFVANLSRCIVFQYRFAGSWPRMRPVAVITNPQSAFDIWTAIDKADQAARNALKNLLASGHKIVSHRGILVHVDRRTENTVFGPSIDTLLLAELLAQAYYYPLANQPVKKNLEGPQTVIEVGSGNGLISAGLIRYLPSISELFCIDIDFAAVSCTEKNLDIATRIPGASRKTKRNLIHGSFQADMFRRRFDLIICNPPYVPVPPGLAPEKVTTPDYFRAVADLALLSDLLVSAPELLAKGGRMLIMLSSVCLEDVLPFLPSNCEVERCLGDEGFEVMFDVEAVLNRSAWIEYLLSKKRLKKIDDVYYHSLHPLWISVKEKSSKEKTNYD